MGYRDYIGWKDAFADPRFTQRQRALATAAGRKSAYTPQVILDGADFDGWRGAGFPTRSHMKMMDANHMKMMKDSMKK